MSKISIIMSVFNSEETLNNSIESILGQSFRDFEFLILDDCSTDKSFKIADKYRVKDKRIKLYRNEENLGLTKSLNILLENSKGDYIARQDSDDISRNKRLEAQLSFIKKFNLDGCTTKAISQQTGKVMHKIANKFPPRVIINYKNPFIHGSLLIFKKTLYQVGCYDENFIFAQDYKLMSELLKNGSAIKIMNDIFYELNTINNISSKYRAEQEYFANCVRKNKVP
jgi:glycosyltransferase involved in cell wall biosynthesis